MLKHLPTFTVRQLLTATCVLSAGLAFFSYFGLLSTAIVLFAILGLIAITYRYSRDWPDRSFNEQLIAVVLAVALASTVLLASCSFWTRDPVKASRLTMRYKKTAVKRNMKISLRRSKFLYVNVTGTVGSKESFRLLRNRLLRDFHHERYIHLHWKIGTPDGPLVDDLDRNLFPNDYTPQNAA